MERPEPVVSATCDAVDAVVRCYIEEYEMDDGESVFFTPSETERIVIADAIHGLLSDPDFVAAWNAWQLAIAQRQT